ncbi:hypothetical protein AB0G73_32545 [Streptomyces sp. NPDC020719]|uniref:hypothetical protein n=1 Tax=Streptomyces sp. NPDC020719 TaxID=3154896 RepID=UPI0033FA2752
MPAVVTALAVPLYVVWALLLASGGGDLAAQFAWAGFAARHPVSAYNLSWYGGAHTANYSLLTPWLMAAFGVRAVSVAAGLSGTWLMALLFVRAAGTRDERGGDGPWRGLWPALLAAAALWCNVVSGRTTFAVGVSFALVACLFVQRGGPGARLVLACASTALATMASPVAGLFLLVVGAAYGLDRQWAKAAALIAAPCAVVAATTLLFPFEGEQPMALRKVWMPLAVCAALLLAAPAARTWKVVRIGAAVYAVGVVLTFLVASPVGSNVERLVGLAGPPVLLAALLAPDLTRTRRIVLAVTLVVSVNWLRDKTLDDIRVSTVTPAWAAHTDGLVGELRRLGADRTRVEVVPARNHREAAVLAADVNDARGWNRQLDVERGRLFYDGSFTSARYRAWLDRWAVGYVAVHDGLPDGPATAEAALVRDRPPWLEHVWRDAHWTVYRVRDAVPLVSAPGAAVGGDDATLVVRMPRAGSATVRIAYSPWLRASGGACVSREGEFVRLTVPRAGEYRLDSPYRWPRGGKC